MICLLLRSSLTVTGSMEEKELAFVLVLGLKLVDESHLVAETCWLFRETIWWVKTTSEICLDLKGTARENRTCSICPDLVVSWI